MSDRPNHLVTTRITITRTLTGQDGEAGDLVGVDVDPSDASLVELLGLLTLAQESVREIKAGLGEDGNE